MSDILINFALHFSQDFQQIQESSYIQSINEK